MNAAVEANHLYGQLVRLIQLELYVEHECDIGCVLRD